MHLKRVHKITRWETLSFQILLLGFVQLVCEDDPEVGSRVGVWGAELREVHSNLE